MSARNATVIDLWEVGVGGGHWSLNFQKHLNDGEMKIDEVDLLMELIYAVSLQTA